MTADRVPDDGADPSRPLNDWLGTGRFALLLAGLITAFFPRIVTGEQAFVLRDFGIFTYPLAFYQRASFWRGEIPFWDPLNNCGIPFLAQWNTMTLYPFSLIYVLLPLTYGLMLFQLAHLAWAGLGMYCLVRHWTENRLAAAFAGVAFVFNGMTLNCLAWTSTLAALAWMPWVILAAERAWPGDQRRLLPAVLAGTLQMLTGTPEVILFTWLVVVVLWGGRLVDAAGMRRQLLVRLPVVILLVGLLSAVQLLPFLDLLAHSERSVGMVTDEWSAPAGGWANLLVPLVHCYQSPLGVYFQPGQDWTSSYYPGIGVLILGIFAVLFIRTLRVGLLAAVAVMGFLLALGTHGALYPAVLKMFPPLGFMRYPVKFAVLATFIIPLLAGLALAAWQAANRERRRRMQTTLAALGLMLGLGVGFILWLDRLHPYPFEPWPIVRDNALVRIIFLVLIPATLWLLGRLRNRRLQVGAGLLLLALVWLDAATFAPSQNPGVEPSVYQPGLLTDRLAPVPRAGEARAYLTRSSHDLFYGSMLTNAAQDYLGRRSVLFGNCNLLENVPVTDGFFPLYLKDQHRLVQQLFLSPTNAPPDGFADFLAISHQSDPDRISSWQFRAAHLPCYSIGAAPVFAEPASIPARLLATNFNPRQTVYLPAGGEGLPEITRPVKATVRAVQWTAHRLEFLTEADAPTLLVLSQTYYHPWRARVNGRPTKIWHANFAFQAVAVPAGRSQVELVYVDSLFWAGAGLSIATFLGCAVVAWRLHRR